MKILCIGRKGDNRSVALAWLLKQKGHDAIAVGMRRMGRDTRKMMLNWADLIIVIHAKCCEGVPKEYRHKMKKWTIPYSEAYPATNKDMLELLEALIKRDKL